ncbi:hypothetical protein [Oscillatoria sp. FACHB-1406]|uniref:hypothetical protein n=1 Tax=Oscillatoria sp. FACHB-1406 TaxID=2692846 RepID=UPI0016864D6D|nr:hypothetical protein [Oscillatoria sp. FACHB-1406]MBD2576384.1 hypothetical protein [Oscillatoria sp. FACHB-1406]
MGATRKSKNPVVEKFYKKDNICNICQKESLLSIDHVPPQCCPPAKSRVTSKLLYQFIGDTSFRPRQDQNGITYKTICANCNNLLGSKYDKALGDFSKTIESFVESHLILPDSFEVEFHPNAVMRSVLGHILAAKTETDNIVLDEIIRPSIINPSTPIHEDIHVFYWVNPYEKTIILRDYCRLAVPGKFDKVGFFNLIKFYPVAFLVTYKLHHYKGLPSLHDFNSLSIHDKIQVKIDRNSTRKESFPERISDRDVLLHGRSADDSVYSLPKSKSKKKKKF